MEQPKVEPLVQPNRQVMLAHVEHLFGGWLQGCQDGLVELAWTETTPNTAGRYALNRAQLFDTDHLDDLVDMAVRLNATPFCNVYIGAALRKQKTPLFGRCDRDDVLALPALYADLDDAGAVANARHVYGDAKPTLVVLTGMVPHSRAQLWWRLDEPLFEPWSDRLEGIAAALGGDAVSNSDRVMRLAGSVAWPVKPGRVAELTAIVPLNEPGLSEYMPEHLAQVFPFTPGQEPDEAAFAPPPRAGSGAFGFASKLLQDGRERHMHKTVMACLAEFVSLHDKAPTAQELFDAAWPQYERGVDLQSRPGRGPDEMAEKCRATIRRFLEGKIRGARTVEETRSTWQRKQAAYEGAPRSARREREERENVRVDPARFPFETVTDLRKLPPVKWLVKGWVPENTTCIMYGKWGAGKSFLGFDLSLHIAYGMEDWHGASLPQGGADVLVLAREGHQGFVQRIDAFKKHHGLIDDTDRLIFMRASVSFMNNEEFKALCAAIKAQEKPFKLVMIDTVARVLSGVEMSKPETITQFMDRCSLLAEVTGAAAIGIHHQNKTGTMMGSVYFEANADVVYEMTRLGSEDDPLTQGEVVCTKMKDGEDRWKRTITYLKMKLATKEDPDRSSLVVEALDDRKVDREGLPSKDVCRRILAAVDERWRVGRPLSHKAQVKKFGNYAPRVLGQQFDVAAEQIEKLIIGWLDNAIVTFEMLDKKTKAQGLRVVGSLD